MTVWTTDEPAALSAEEALALSGGTETDVSVEVGFVLVGEALFVRAFRGAGSRWFRAARAERRGRIRVGAFSRDVVSAADGARPAQIDEAYRAKYGAATLRITPA